MICSLGLRDFSRKNQFLPGTIRPGRDDSRKKIERDGSRKNTGTIRSKSNSEVDSPIFVIYYIFMISVLLCKRARFQSLSMLVNVESDSTLTLCHIFVDHYISHCFRCVRKNHAYTQVKSSFFFLIKYMCYICSKRCKRPRVVLSCDSCWGWQHRGCGNAGMFSFNFRLKGVRTRWVAVLCL